MCDDLCVYVGGSLTPIVPHLFTSYFSHIGFRIFQWYQHLLHLFLACSSRPLLCCLLLSSFAFVSHLKELAYVNISVVPQESIDDHHVSREPLFFSCRQISS